MDRLKTCRDTDRKIIRVYTKRFFMVLSGKAVSKWGLCFGPSGVFGGPQFQQNYNIMSLVTNSSVWEGDTALCMSKLVWMQKIPGVYGGNPRVCTSAHLGALTAHAAQLWLHTSVWGHTMPGLRRVYCDLKLCPAEIKCFPCKITAFCLKISKVTLGTSPSPLASW